MNDFWPLFGTGRELRVRDDCNGEKEETFGFRSLILRAVAFSPVVGSIHLDDARAVAARLAVVEGPHPNRKPSPTTSWSLLART